MAVFPIPYLFSDNSVDVSGVDVSVYFRSLEEKLIEAIAEARIVVGCVAWLTQESILGALAQVRNGVSIIVQKEDFLRPDLGSDKNGWKNKLRAMYDALPEPPDRYNIGGLVENLSTSSIPSFQPVRCVGNFNRDNKPTMPRMHNKFVVFCGAVEGVTTDGVKDIPVYQPIPYAIWTGSFNFMKNAMHSFENAVLIRNERVARAYFDEWQQVLALSERLDWTSEWVEPEWRVGT